MPLTLAIDYDSTFTALPRVATLNFIRALKNDGCRVFIVSSRSCECTPDEKCENHCYMAGETGCSVILTSGSAKKWFVEQRGIRVDIWVDDCPESILQGK